MNEIKLLKNIHNKKSILYTIDLYIEDSEYSIDEDDKFFKIEIKNKTKEEITFIKQEINFNSLRFEIADSNKESRNAIISKALGSINI